MSGKKILTFSYDDGVTQDVRLIELFDKYGMRATFNLNSELLGREGAVDVFGARVNHNKISPADVRAIYSHHEVASHTLTHPRLPDIADENEIIRQVECDRIKLSELSGQDVTGFAYPCGGVNFDRRVSEILKNKTGVIYARNIISSHSFGMPENPHELYPSVHHTEFDKLFELGEKLISSNSEQTQMLYVWGHSYEFDADDSWGRFEEFLQMMSKKNDILYLTNKESLGEIHNEK